MREFNVRDRGFAHHARDAGFTLNEVMVVVVLVAIVAMLAVPNMSAAREDRLAFREANTFAELIHGARMQAMGRGAAQLVTITSSGAADRGTMLVFESRSAQGRPQSACRMPGIWADVLDGVARARAGENINGEPNSLQVRAGLETELREDGIQANARVICFTPGGRTYVAPTIAALPTTQPFVGDLVLSVIRRPGGGNAIGLTRNVIMTASGATRIQSR